MKKYIVSWICDGGGSYIQISVETGQWNNHPSQQHSTSLSVAITSCRFGVVNTSIIFIDRRGH